MEFGEVLKSMPVPSPHERVGVELQFAARSLKRVFNKLVLLEKKSEEFKGLARENFDAIRQVVRNGVAERVKELVCVRGHAYWILIAPALDFVRWANDQSEQMLTEAAHRQCAAANTIDSQLLAELLKVDFAAMHATDEEQLEAEGVVKRFKDLLNALKIYTNRWAAPLDAEDAVQIFDSSVVSLHAAWRTLSDDTDFIGKDERAENAMKPFTEWVRKAAKAHLLNFATTETWYLDLLAKYRKDEMPPVLPEKKYVMKLAESTPQEAAEKLALTLDFLTGSALDDIPENIQAGAL